SIRDLPVQVASHTGRVAQASVRFCDDLAHVNVRSVRTGARLITSIDAVPVLVPKSALDKLSAQISQTVRWADTLHACLEAGATMFLELGPGQALADMASALPAQVTAYSFEEFRSIEGARAWTLRARE